MNIEKDVQKIVALYDGGHDWSHIQRVRSTAKKIAIAEDADLNIVDLCALMHDIGDHKFSENGYDLLVDILNAYKVTGNTRDIVIDTWQNISYSKGKIPNSLEGKCVQDADRLDAIGAIGIARAFTYGGYKNRQILDLNDAKNPETTVGHFYDKLFDVAYKMNTLTGKKIAQERDEFMHLFVNQLIGEIF